MSAIIESFVDDDAVGMDYVNGVDTSKLGQTFVMPAAFTLDQIDVRLCRLGLPGNTAISFCPVVDDVIGEEEFSIIFNASTLTTNVIGEWKQFSFAEKAFAAGTYALVLWCPGATDLKRVWWIGMLGGDSYTNGEGYYYSVADDEWVDEDGDFLFRLYGYMFTPPTGKPTKKRLIALAKNALWYESVA